MVFAAYWDHNVKVNWSGLSRELVDHVDQLRAGFASWTGRKCDTCKALEFSTFWFGTRRLKVQILSPRPLPKSCLSLVYATFSTSPFILFCGPTWTNSKPSPTRSAHS